MAVAAVAAGVLFSRTRHPQQENPQEIQKGDTVEGDVSLAALRAAGF